MRFRVIPNQYKHWLIQEKGFLWGWNTITEVCTLDDAKKWLDELESAIKHYQQKPYERFIDYE